jgi:hypothetical protein
MKMKTQTLLAFGLGAILAAPGLCAAQDSAAPTTQAQTQAAPAAAPSVAPAPAPAAAPQAAPAAPLTKEQKKAAWEANVKKACSAETADGGVCAGKDFDSGLEKCLQQNREADKLSDGCKAVVHAHHKKGGKAGAQAGDAQPAPAATTPQQ